MNEVTKNNGKLMAYERYGTKTASTCEIQSLSHGDADELCALFWMQTTNTSLVAPVVLNLRLHTITLHYTQLNLSILRPLKLSSLTHFFLDT